MQAIRTAAVTPLIKEQHTGLHITIIPRMHCDMSLLLQPLGAETPRSMFRRLAEVLHAYGAAIVRMRMFGDITRRRAILKDLAELCGPVDWPVTWVQGRSCGTSELAGIMVKAAAAADITRIHLDGRPVGSVIENDFARYCYLADLQPSDTSAPRAVQTRETFDRMRAALALAGMQLTDVVRTWLCLDDILDWYDEFNTVRTSLFEEYGVFEQVVPASTGVGGANIHGAAIIADAFAMQSGQSAVSCTSIPSPLQCPAIDYNSSFSRATEVHMPDYRFLYISGTASIDPDGATMHAGSMRRQVEQTFQVIEAILESRGMSIADVMRGIAYCKRREDAPVFTRYCAEHGYDALPVIVTESTVCRDDLLFELQVDSVLPAGN